jgi:hypothetical protein
MCGAQAATSSIMNDLTEDEVIKLLRLHFEGLFPKVCPSCNRCFPSLREYILITKRLGAAMSYDAELGDWKTSNPIGSVALANCPCGSTLSLGTEGMPLPKRLSLLNWVRIETHRRGMSPQQLLEYLRDIIRQQVLAESDKDETSKQS